jgi:hypothetical protein
MQHRPVGAPVAVRQENCGDAGNPRDPQKPIKNMGFNTKIASFWMIWDTQIFVRW